MKAKTIVKIIVAIIIAVAVIQLIRSSRYAEYFTPEYIRETTENAGAWGPLVFACIYYIVSMFMVSTVALAIAAGVLFGPVSGSAIVIITAAIAAQSAFYLSRFFGSSVLEKMENQKSVTGKLLKKLDGNLDKGGFRAFFIMRCLFVPYIPASYASGLLPKAHPKDFFLATFITNAIFSPAFVYFGDSIFKGPQALILPAVLIAIVLSIPKITKRLKRNND